MIPEFIGMDLASGPDTTVKRTIPSEEPLEIPQFIRKINQEAIMAIEGTSDERVVNNVMRHEYRILTDEEKQQMKALKDQGLDLIELIDAIGASRELSLAKTKLEEAVMWAVKHITR